MRASRYGRPDCMIVPPPTRGRIIANGRKFIIIIEDETGRELALATTFKRALLADITESSEVLDVHELVRETSAAPPGDATA
jgi:hypothetical protein